MTDAEKLEYVAAAAGITTEADRMLVSSVYLPSAKAAVLSLRYPFSSDPSSEEWESRYDLVQCDAAVEMWNRRGAEGEQSHGENGVTRTWSSSSLSAGIVGRIVPKGGVPK